MVVQRLMRLFGVGGPTVRTELSVSRAKPGGRLKGTVEVTGGDHQVTIGYVALALVADVGVEGGLPGRVSTVEFHRQRVVEGFTLAARERRVFDVTFDVPLETPLTRAFGQQLAGMKVGLRTELEVAREVDRTDEDPVEIDPTPAQQHILDTLVQLGFQFAKADLERGRLRSLPQTLPFYQEIEFLPGPAYAQHLRNLEVSFVTTDRKLHVVLELDRRVGLLADRDIFGRFTVDPATIADTDWKALLQDWLTQSTTRRGPLL
ncbi:sporulation protein [Catellatospora tritici]|uniref:sporulation protein n=1 Tax=Catellatospora tritici TaxID=2851566 RepID=UPI001C2D4AAB|nr:sporulation protein [Catellatospora tritici]MBV1851476.1 sporulation protein [Catellatospora tritici]